MAGLFITGTDTGIGKTFVTAGLANAMRELEINIGVMKPVATGCKQQGKNLISLDAEFLKKASGVKDPISLIAPYRFRTPSSPYWASKVEGKPIHLKKIMHSFKTLQGRHDLVLVEGVGGLMAPVTRKVNVVDLIKMLQLPILLVAPLRVGTINHTLLSLQCAQLEKIAVLGLLFNQEKSHSISGAEKANPEIIALFSKIKCFGVVPHLRGTSVEKGKLDGLKEAFQKISYKILKDILNRKI